MNGAQVAYTVDGSNAGAHRGAAWRSASTHACAATRSTRDLTVNGDHVLPQLSTSRATHAARSTTPPGNDAPHPQSAAVSHASSAMGLQKSVPRYPVGASGRRVSRGASYLASRVAASIMAPSSASPSEQLAIREATSA